MADAQKSRNGEDQCAHSCHDTWTECLEKKPEEANRCNTRLARCVKECTKEK